MVAPVLAEIANENAGQLTVAKLDVDANPETARNFEVVSIPTLILFKDGEPVKRIVGAKGKAALLRELSDAVPGSASSPTDAAVCLAFSLNRRASATIPPSLSIKRQGCSHGSPEALHVETAPRRRRSTAPW